MITAIIVDDELKGAKTLEILIRRYCPQVDILGIYEGIEEARVAVDSLRPQLLFLDIEMPFGNGFQLIEKLPEYDYEVIFTTAYNHYAIHAIKVEAVDYLLKPIEIEELVAAVAKAEKRLAKLSGHASEDMQRMMAQWKEVQPRKLMLPTSEGIFIVNSNEVVSFEADSNYTYVYLETRKRILISKTLKTFEKMIEGLQFMRVHNSYIVNLSQAEKYVKGDGGTLVMRTGLQVPVSRAYKQDLLAKIGIELI
ncbi:MAG: response regulator transcription factor [Bacteroidetes bacterium]|nr:response regulator transcription factor [Bacteroidota bacterium]